ncbi:hypothetical protein [Acinetobacter sp. P8-3-8]|uniref:hypothetical protein n=1 Tax=Acinetobacter sp. P8-3-8 TaxID=1029823 RepID=UPI0002486CAD|nr:hypothetical protein [Acinetobacter sp. P8-3-8]
MFRKGIVTFFDDRLGLGHIELASDHQQVVFKLENFSNTSILPQIGERVKCIVVEEHGEFLAKFIVRLDHKNYVADKNKQPSSKLVYDESSFENVHNSRKILKKRRISADTIAHKNEHISENAVVDQNIPAAKDNNEPASSKNVFATQSTQTVQFQRVAIQPQIIKSSSYTEKFVEVIKPIQIIEKHNVVEEVPVAEITESVSDEVILEEVATIQEVDASEPILNESINEAVEEIIPEPVQSIQIEAISNPVVEETPVIEISEPVLNESINDEIQAVEKIIPEPVQSIQVEAVSNPVVEETPVIEISEPVLNESINDEIQAVEEIIPEPVQSIQIEAVSNPVVEETPVIEISEPVLNESIYKPVEAVQPVELIKPTQNHLHIDKSMESIVANEQTFKEVPALDTVVAEKEIPVPKVKSVDLQQQLRDRQLLEKKMNLSGFQKFIQQMKVKFLYSKRKQVQVKPEVKKRFHFNPWILVTGVVLLVTINFGFYAHDRYTEYKSENLLKLQQYEKEQKEEIKRQKREATAR